MSRSFDLQLRRLLLQLRFLFALFALSPSLEIRFY